MPGKCPPRPSALDIDLAQHLAKGEYAIESVEIEFGELLRSRDRPVMGIVKQQLEFDAAGTAPADTRDQGRRIPFVHENEIGTFQHLIQVERSIVCMEVDAGNERGCVTQGGCAIVLQRVDTAPAVPGLADDDFMTQSRQFARHAAQEMRVAVVPAGGEGVIEQYRFHASISPPSLACERREPLAHDAYSER